MERSAEMANAECRRANGEGTTNSPERTRMEDRVLTTDSTRFFTADLPGGTRMGTTSRLHNGLTGHRGLRQG